MKISGKVKEQTRIRLLEAAVDVITEKGFDKASMREIAKRADVADATIYKNFFSMCLRKPMQRHPLVLNYWLRPRRY